jgi:hypothetical protein
MQKTTVCNSSELFVHHQTDGDIAMATQGDNTEASAEFHGDPKVSAVPQGEHEVTGVSEHGKLFLTCAIGLHDFFPCLFRELTGCINICYYYSRGCPRCIRGCRAACQHFHEEASERFHGRILGAGDPTAAILSPSTGMAFQKILLTCLA